MCSFAPAAVASLRLADMVTIDFDYGTLVLDGEKEDLALIAGYCTPDPRIGKLRSEAKHYAPIVLTLHRSGIPFTDRARDFSPLELILRSSLEPRPYQREAVRAWKKNDRRGTVVLPTGSGKSYVAQLAMRATQRPTLVVAPTIDLVQQWAAQLAAAFPVPVGMLGGGSRDVQPITVSTYDSAVIMMEFIGNRFGLLIADECHHLPGPVYRQLANMSIAPFRLGLTATPEGNEEDDSILAGLLGPLCFRRDIDEMEGTFLAPYKTVRIELDLDPDEEEEYTRQRAVYMDFVRSNGINFSDPRGWSQFLGLCACLAGGRKAFNAYLAQRTIARRSRAKFRRMWELFRRHAGERILVFTADNDTAYDIGRRFLVPVLTHHTKIQERRAFLEAFRAGDYPVLVTSKVLNEGIDVPEASVGIILSGTGSIREHVQRLGRILRPVKGKQARLYELVSAGTSETSVSERRRQHRAYQRSH